jgi:hypothetical protein
MKWIAVVLVVVIVALLYFAVIGTSKSLPNLGPKEDPTGQERNPIAYILVNARIGISKPPGSSWEGGFTSFSVDTYPWISGVTQQTYSEKLDLLGLFSSKVELWLEFTISGPGRYLPGMIESEHKKVDVSAWDFIKHVNFGPYSAQFWDAGAYTLKCDYYRMADGHPDLLNQKTVTFTVTR